MIQRDLLIVCGSKNSSEVERYADFIKQSFGVELNIVHIENENIFKGLDEAIYIKNKLQLETPVEYRYCYFLSTDIKEELSYPKNLNQINLKNIKMFGTKDGKVSLKFWYCNSIDFDIVGKFWKSNFVAICEQRYINVHAKTQTLTDIFIHWLAKIRVYLNIDYVGEIKIEKTTFPPRYYRDKKRVAICLSGESRSLEVTKKFYDYVIKNTDYDIDFFISTWETNYEDALKTIPNLKDIEILDEDSFIHQIKVQPNVFSNNHRYSFLMKRCNLLKQRHEIKNDFVYDVVLISRLDTIWDENDLFVKYQNNVSGRKFDTFTTMFPDTARYNDTFKFIDDNFLITNSMTSDVYSNIHFFYYKDLFKKIHHSLEVNAFVLDYYNILNFGGSNDYEIIRNTNLYQWLQKLKSFNWHDVTNIIREINTLRFSESFVGTMVIDCRDKDFLFEKLGYLTHLEHYLKQLGCRWINTDVIFIIDKLNINKFYDLNLSITPNVKSFKVMEYYFVENIEKKIMMVKPDDFPNISHNDFWDSMNNNKSTYLEYEKEINVLSEKNLINEKISKEGIQKIFKGDSSD